MAMKVDSKRFREELSSVNAAMIDSNILIYHLEDLEPYSELTEILFTRLGEGRLKLIVSTLSVTELMAKPYAEGNLKKINASVSFLRTIPNCEWISPDFEISLDAAALRGKYGIRTPDAILIATGRKAKAQIFITNDLELKRTKDHRLKIMILDEYKSKD